MSIKLGTLDISYNEAEEILKELLMDMDEITLEVEENILELVKLVNEHGDILNMEKSQHRKTVLAGGY